MQWYVWVVIVAVIYFLVMRMLPAKGVESINTEELKLILSDRDKQFIDVRTPGEFAGKKIKQFTNIPLQQIKSQLDTIDRGKEIVLICQSGMRSSQAAKILKNAGFPQVTNVSGGMQTWRD